MALFFIGLFVLASSISTITSHNSVERLLARTAFIVALFFLFAGLSQFTLAAWLVLGVVIGVGSLLSYLYMRIQSDIESEKARKQEGLLLCKGIWDEYRDLRRRLSPEQLQEAQRLFDACDAQGLHFYLEMQDVARVRPTLSVRQ